MAATITLNVRVSGALSEFVTAQVSEGGSYENVSEYVRDLIRRDKNEAEAAAFARLKAELASAFGAPDESYETLDAETVIRRGQARFSA
ncbi:ribbon-helix-helix domain-containing protein [Caulobacter endophyticus]|uniref:ribbon-helix-helix domain-containing protein n=1 Tax=Caulobacter endophyticus TaxID=2172652 RepID=UPI002410B33B|nr:addiction module antitoxin [Caulobacter endophyticus]MDG2528154.1 addiction module antitoxin [Caulobacter endophyticus]